MNKKRSACLYCGNLVRIKKRYCKCKKALIRSIAGRFLLVELLNIQSGVLAFKGWDEVDYRPVFIRVALPTATCSEKEGLEIEARLLREVLGNDYFSKYISGGRIPETGGLYTVCEFISGRTLFEASATFSPTRKIELIVQMLKALKVLHEKGFVLTNICAENFLIIADGGIKLVNLRCSQPSGERNHGMGKEGYIAPEQQSPFEVLTPATDVFAMACLSYKLLTDSFPYPGTPGKEELFCAGHGPRQLSSVNKSIIPAVEEVLNKALELDPEKRFMDAGEMQEALWEAFTGSTIVDASGIEFGRSPMDCLRDGIRTLDDLDAYMIRTGRNWIRRITPYLTKNKVFK